MLYVRTLAFVFISFIYINTFADDIVIPLTPHEDNAELSIGETNYGRLKLGLLSGDAISFNQSTQYLTIQLTEIADIHEIIDPRKKTLTNKFLGFFIDRKRYGIATAEFFIPNSKKNIKTILFSFEHTGDDNYSIERISGENGTPYSLTNDFVVPSRDPITVKITLHSWDDDANISLAKKALNGIGDTPLGSTEYYNIVSLVFDFIEKIIPQSDQKETLQFHIEQNSITNENLSIGVIDNETGQTINFLTFKFKISEAYFQNNDLGVITTESVFESESERLNEWQKSFIEAGGTKDINAVKTISLAYGNYVGLLPLVSKDKAKLIAGSLHTWLTDWTKSDCLDHCIGAYDYEAITNANRDYVINTDWDFKIGTCNSPACKMFYKFFSKSTNIHARNNEGIEFIRTRMSIQTDTGVAWLTQDEYVNNFEILNNKSFTHNSSSHPLHSFEFDNTDSSLRLIINNDIIKDKKINFNASWEDESLYINGLEILSD